MRALAVALGVAVLGSGLAALWIWSGGSSGSGSAGEPGDEPGPSAPLVFERHPVGGSSHAAPAEEDVSGIERAWIERNNQAHRMLEAGELEDAVELLESCHEALPERTVFRRNLAEALVRLARHERENRDLASAIAHLERAIALAPDRDDVEALREHLERWRREWEHARNHTTELSLYFEVSYDAARDDILLNSQEAITFLDAAYVDMTEWFLVDPVLHEGKPKLRVVLYDREEFDDITGLGEWAGGVFDGTIRVSVGHLSDEAEQWGRVLRHELVHAFVGEVAGAGVPGWLNEGLAQYLDASIHLNPHRTESVRRARESLRGADLYPLDELAGSLASWTDTEAISRAYAESLAVVDFIARQYGVEALRVMLEGCADGEGIEAAFLRWSGGVGLEEVLEFLRGEL